MSVPEHLFTLVLQHVRSAFTSLTCCSGQGFASPSPASPGVAITSQIYKEDDVALDFSLKFFYSAVKTKKIAEAELSF